MKKHREPAIDKWRRAATLFNEHGWFLPAYVIGRAVFELAEKIEAAPRYERSEIVRDGVCGLYPPRALAVMYLYRYREWPFVREFAPTIWECIEAASYGFLGVATTGLAPVVEGVARAIARDQQIPVPRRAATLLRNVLDDVGSRSAEATHPAAREEVELVIASYRRFFEERFWRDSDRLPEGESLNRHSILHGIADAQDYGTRYNFSRLISVLDLHCLLITFIQPPEKRLSNLYPDETSESRELAQYLASAAVGRLRALSRFQPELPGPEK